MDVRCEKCLTEYEFDDARVTEAGVTVKCTTCGHVFKVRKAASAAPLPHADEFSPEAAQIDRVREWKIRQPAGNIFTCRELTTLQKWIVERKVARDDEISLSGDSWKRLGDIPELAGFFLVVDQANKAHLLEQQLRGPQPGHSPTLLSSPTMPPKRPTSGGYQMGAGGPQRGGHEPTWLQPPPDSSYDDEDLRAIKKRGPGLWLGVIVVLLAGAGGAYAYLRSQGLFGGVGANAQGTTGTAPTQIVTPPPVVPVAVPVVPIDSGPAYVDSGPAYVDAGPAYVDAGPRYVDAGPAYVDAGPPAPTVKIPSRPKTFEGFMAEGARLQQRGKAEPAMNAYQEAIELEPGSAEAWTGKAQALIDMESYPAAEDAFRKALSISARFSDAQFGLAEALKFQGRKAEAVKQYKKFISDHPDDAENVAIAKRAIADLSD